MTDFTEAIRGCETIDDVAATYSMLFGTETLQTIGFTADERAFLKAASNKFYRGSLVSTFFHLHVRLIRSST